MKTRLLFVLFLSFFTSIFSLGQLAIESVNFDTIHTFNSIEGIGGDYFLDETNELYLAHSYNPKGIEISRLEVIAGIDTFNLSLFSPLKLSNFERGSISLSIQPYDINNNPISYSATGINTTKLRFMSSRPWFEQDTVVFGVLMMILALIFYSASLPAFAGFYKYVPALLLCYFIPAILNSFGIISSEISGLYGMAKNFLLPASLVLLCLNIDLKGVVNLGPKALIMFFAATIGIVIGGPLAFWLMGMINPEILGEVAGSETWKGLSTISGSWIGGGANQTAMKEISGCGEKLFSMTIIVDTLVANVFMAILLYGSGVTKKIDKWLKADSSAIKELEVKMENYQKSVRAVPEFKHLILIAGVAFLAVSIAHWLAGFVGPMIDDSIQDTLKENPNHWIKYLDSLGSKFFWLILISTFIGVALSFTKARRLEGYGASKFGSIFIYILVATIGMHMDIAALIQDWSKAQYLIYIGLIWITFHAIFLIAIAKLIKAPFFFVAVGSQANVGGAASAPVVAAAFNPALAPVGVILAVMGYAVGTVGAYACMIMLKMVAV